MSWASEELKYANIGDKRLNRRLITIVEDLSSKPTASIPEASRDNAAMDATYKFFRNRRISSNSILESHSRQTLERLSNHDLVLSIQDTTELDFSSHSNTRGLGPLSNPLASGLHVHSALCVSPEGVPLGLLHQHVWSRSPKQPGPVPKSRKRQITEKESHRWLAGLQVTQSLIPSDTAVVMVSDREGDIYELFSTPRRPGSEFLIRASHNRQVKSPSSDSDDLSPLWSTLRSSPLQGEHTLELQRTPKRVSRSATLSIRYSRVELQPPLHHPEHAHLAPVQFNALLAEELDPPAGTKAISWLLLTTLPLDSLEQAIVYLFYYESRWLIERYHLSLKSGCCLEELQLESADRLERALSTYAIVAWRLLWLTYESRVHPDISVLGILERHEWQALYCFIHKVSTPASEPPSLKDSILWIAKLGGFLGRKGDGPPGLRTLWRGLERLNDISASWQLFAGHSP